MEKLNGVIKYTIEADGCLIGIFTNSKSDGDIRPETAKKMNKQDCIDGEYSSSYFDNSSHNCKLTINKVKGTIYDFIWSKNEDKNQKIYKGIGMKIDDKTIIVSYWEA